MSAPLPLLADPARAGLYLVAAADFGAIAQAAREAGLLARHIDLRGCRGKTAVLRRFAEALDVPPTFGGNWDALADSLRDLDWLPAGGYVLMLERDAPLRHGNRTFDVLLDVLEEAALAWAERGVPFWALVAMPDPAG